jgi:hypothetical protein
MRRNGSGFGTGMVFSLVAIAAGAIMYWAVTAPTHGFRLSTVGVVLMFVGAAGLAISGGLWASSRSGRRQSTFVPRDVVARVRRPVYREDVMSPEAARRSHN